MPVLCRLRAWPRCRPRGGGTRGVTILELLLATAVVVPRLDWSRYQADASARGVMAELATAQRLALSLQVNMIITFPDSIRMKIVDDDNNNGTPDNGERVRYVVLENHFAFGKAPAPDIPAPDAPATITGLTFHRDGSADVSGTLYLHGPGSDPHCKHCRAVAITRSTGRGVWYSYGAGAWTRSN